ncbi:hypothetical protein XA68_18408 [Ophiocordyceps unilateralis]|uniref:Transcription factor domain-containing protein n=1 Tax=Ophiocordyceps unilateralis TaxID=268505 RepID=A0A2A9P367_OPHUN|nr:hypothetical protein XA68_18408 [Ophiocordyceps unilateralis]
MADGFVAATARLRGLKPPPGEQGDDQEKQYDQVLATSHCGAINLVRMLRLATLWQANASAVSIQDDEFMLNQLASAPSQEGSLQSNRRSADKKGAADGVLATQSSLHLIMAKMFQLAEWVYRVLAVIVPLEGHDSSRWSRVLTTYTKCLGWYDSFFALPGTDASHSPFVLFVHIFYQFCLLRLFWPLVTSSDGEKDERAHDICRQAAQSILRLSESYAGVFGLRHVSPLITYFVFASGRFSLEAEEAGRGIINSGSVRTDVSSTAKMKAEDEETSPAPFVVMSAVAHARLLLAEMSETHPVAAVAEHFIGARPCLS